MKVHQYITLKAHLRVERELQDRIVALQQQLSVARQEADVASSALSDALGEAKFYRERAEVAA